MDDLDMLLSVIENPTRRKILEALVREPHYPLQLSRELGLSQQGIVKHLKVLEDLNLVRSHSEVSDQGGPSRKIYVPTTGFTIVVDIGPGFFNTELVTRDLEPEEEVEYGTLEDEDREKFKDKVLEVRKEIEAIDEELDELTGRRVELLRSRERSLNEAYNMVESVIDDYQTRRVLYEFMQRPERDAKAIAKALGMRDDQVKGTIKEYAGGK
ncbi:MAG: helix-turn-helix domain-containing protein [Methanomassiliicoccales archaeon]|jgi:predicted transcriptional regulator